MTFIQVIPLISKVLMLQAFTHLLQNLSDSHTVNARETKIYFSVSKLRAVLNPLPLARATYLPLINERDARLVLFEPL